MDIAESSHGTVVAMCHSSGLGQEWKDSPGLPSIEAKSRTESADCQVAEAWLWDKRGVSNSLIMVLETS